jgi:hypothetical protein
MGYAGDYKASTLRAWRSRDECRQASVVVAASFPRRLRHLSATVLQCLRHGLWGGGSGGSAAMSGPLNPGPPTSLGPRGCYPEQDANPVQSGGFQAAVTQRRPLCAPHSLLFRPLLRACHWGGRGVGDIKPPLARQSEKHLATLGIVRPAGGQIALPCVIFVQLGSRCHRPLHRFGRHDGSGGKRRLCNTAHAPLTQRSPYSAVGIAQR